MFMFEIAQNLWFNETWTASRQETLNEESILIAGRKYTSCDRRTVEANASSRPSGSH